MSLYPLSLELVNIETPVSFSTQVDSFLQTGICTFLTRRPPRLWATKTKGLVEAWVHLRSMESDSRRVLARSRMRSGVSFPRREVYPNAIIRASGPSCGNKSLGQHVSELVKVFVGWPCNPCTNTMLLGSFSSASRRIHPEFVLHRWVRWLRKGNESKSRPRTPFSSRVQSH